MEIFARTVWDEDKQLYLTFGISRPNSLPPPPIITVFLGGPTRLQNSTDGPITYFNTVTKARARVPRKPAAVRRGDCEERGGRTSGIRGVSCLARTFLANGLYRHWFNDFPWEFG